MLGRQLMLCTFVFLFTQVRKTKGLECGGIVVGRFVTVYRSTRCDDYGNFWNKGAVREREDFQY